MQSQTESSWASACIRKSLISDKLKKMGSAFCGNNVLLTSRWQLREDVSPLVFPVWCGRILLATTFNLRDEQQWTKSYHPTLVLDLTCGSMGANPCSQVAKSCVKPSREAEAITVWHKHVHGLTMTCSAVTNGCNVQISSCMLHIT